MQATQPQLREIKKKYKDDRLAQQGEMMRLQQEEGVNPLTGCLPMLLQIPIFVSLFHVVRYVSNSASLCHPIQVQNTKLSLYGFTATQTCSAADAKLFGGPRAGSLTDSQHTIESTLRPYPPRRLVWWARRNGRMSFQAALLSPSLRTVRLTSLVLGAVLAYGWRCCLLAAVDASRGQIPDGTVAEIRPGHLPGWTPVVATRDACRPAPPTISARAEGALWRRHVEVARGVRRCEERVDHGT